MSLKSFGEISLFGFSAAFDAGKVVHLSRFEEISEKEKSKNLKEPQTICAVVQKQYLS